MDEEIEELKNLVDEHEALIQNLINAGKTTLNFLDQEHKLNASHQQRINVLEDQVKALREQLEFKDFDTTKEQTETSEGVKHGSNSN
jgi:hypothetical protein